MADISRVEKDRRDALVVRNLAEGMPPAQAIMEAGYSSATAYTKREEILQRISKNSPMIEALDEEKVTTKYLARKIRRGLNAKKTQRLVVDKSVEQFTDIDHGTRHRYLETALRLRGEDPDKHAESTTVETFEERVRRLRGISSGRSVLPAVASSD